MGKKKQSPVKSTKRHPGQVNQIRASVSAQQFSGPIPSPDIINSYNQIIPGAAERILVMAEKEQAHAITTESAFQKNVSEEIKRGQLFGLFVSLSAFATSIAALTMGYENAAMVIGGATVVGLVTVFVTGRTIKTK